MSNENNLGRTPSMNLKNIPQDVYIKLLELQLFFSKQKGRKVNLEVTIYKVIKEYSIPKN